MWIIRPHCYQLSFGCTCALAMESPRWLCPLCLLTITAVDNSCFLYTASFSATFSVVKPLRFSSAPNLHFYFFTGGTGLFLKMLFGLRSDVFPPYSTIWVFAKFATSLNFIQTQLFKAWKSDRLMTMRNLIRMFGFTVVSPNSFICAFECFKRLYSVHFVWIPALWSSKALLCLLRWFRVCWLFFTTLEMETITWRSHTSISATASGTRWSWTVTAESSLCGWMVAGAGERSRLLTARARRSLSTPPWWCLETLFPQVTTAASLVGTSPPEWDSNLHFKKKPLA